MRRALALALAATLSGAVPAWAQDDYPVCSGDTEADAVEQKPAGSALAYGITPRVQAGQVGPAPAEAKPEDGEKTMAALGRLRPSPGPFVLRLNRFFWRDGERGIQQFLAEARRYTDAGYLVELQLRYQPSEEQEGDMAAWTAYVREVVDRFGPNPGVVALQVANEVNFDFSADSSDGAYEGARDAVVQGVIAAKDEVARTGFRQLKVGFNWAYRSTPNKEAEFWNHLRVKGGRAFVDALDWFAVDAYPGTFFPPAEASVEDYRDGMVNAMSAIRCYGRVAGIPDSLPLKVEENGWPTYGSRRPEMQAAVLEAMVRAVHDFRGTYNVTDYRWFNLRDADSSHPAIAQHYGLLFDDYSEKPAFAVYERLVDELSRRDGGAAAPTRWGGRRACVRVRGRRSLGGLRLGLPRGDAIGRLGPPRSQTARTARWCVRGGGSLRAGFTKAGRVRFIMRTKPRVLRGPRGAKRRYWVRRLG